VGARVVVAVRPEGYEPSAWPLEDGIRRYIVLTLRDGLILEMKSCADRSAAVSYAEAD